MIESKKQAPQSLKDIAESKSIEELSTDQILQFFSHDNLLVSLPENHKYIVDPRNGEGIIFNPTRANRPHNYPESDLVSGEKISECPICQGTTTGILDWVDLSEGFSFINKNLYPVLTVPSVDQLEGLNHNAVIGLHFVQWTSSIHTQDWHNMSIADCVLVMKRLAALEKVLIRIGRELSKKIDDQNKYSKDEWYISIIKNFGALVGSSLEHGHQQIILGNVPPRRIKENLGFKERTNQTYSEFILASVKSDLIIEDYGSAVLFVSMYMRRPFEMVLALKDPQKSYLHEMNQKELLDVTRGWKDASRIFRQLFPELKREIAFNFITHNGPGAGIYFEFLPYTQEQGGFEQLGLSVSQADPVSVANKIRIHLEQLTDH